MSPAPTTTTTSDSADSDDSDVVSPKESESILSDDYFLTHWYYLVAVAMMFLCVAAVLIWCILRNNHIIAEEERKETAAQTARMGGEEAINLGMVNVNVEDNVGMREFHKVNSISPTPSPLLGPRMVSTASRNMQNVTMAGMSLTMEHRRQMSDVQMSMVMPIPVPPMSRPQSLVVGRVNTADEAEQEDDDDLYAVGSVDTRGAAQTVGSSPRGSVYEAPEESEEGSQDNDVTDEQDNEDVITPH